VGAELIHADIQMDGWTDMTKLIGAFCKYATVPNKSMYRYSYSFLS
jgi:hypothetical protein